MQYRLLAVFIGSFFFGDSVIITAAYLAGQLGWPVVPIFIAAVLGVVAADTAWFLVGVFAARHGARIRFFDAQREKVARLLEKITGQNPHWALVYIKFLYGARIAMILYVAARGVSFRTFSLYNTFGILLWFVIFFPLGYLAGRGLARALPLINVVGAATIVFIVSFIVLRLFNIWLTRNIENRR